MGAGVIIRAFAIMNPVRAGCAIAGLSLTLTAPLFSGVAQVAPAAAPAEPELTLPSGQAPKITLASLGLSDGITFANLDGRSDLSFPVPLGSWLGGFRLVLPYRASAARPVPRTLTVTSGDKVLEQFPVSGDGQVEVAIPREAIVSGTLPISLRYSGGVSTDRCRDGRLAADHLTFDPDGGLALDPVPGITPPVAATIAMLGTAPTIVLPLNPNAEQAAAALTIVAGRGDSLLSNVGDGDGSAIRIGGPGDPALRSLGTSVLAIGGRDPAGAARAAFGGQVALPDSPVIDRIRSASPVRGEVTFGELGVSPATVYFGESHVWSATLPAARIPGGRSIKGLSIDVAAVADGRPDRLSAWLNGTMLGSAPLAASGITHLKVRARQGLTNAINSISVRIDRPAKGDCGEAHLGMPAQLLASSRIDLGEPEELKDFHNFASASAAGVAIVMPSAASLPLAARAVAALLSINVPVKVSYGAIATTGPAIVIARSQPAGTTAPLRVDSGRMILEGSASGEHFDVPESPSDTVVQLLDRKGGPLLWIRPAASGAVPATMWLDKGDVAIVNPAGMVQALSTHRDRLAAPTEIEPQSWWDRNGWLAFLIAGAAIGLALLIWSLRPSLKRTKPGSPK